MRRQVLIAALAASLACASAQAGPIVIDNDHGGNVDTFLLWYGRLRTAGTPVILRGICESACTFIVTLPKSQVCVEPTASLGFHLAVVNDHDEPEVTGSIVRRWYPESVRRWLATRKLRAVPTYMTAAEIVSLGIFPACAEPDVE